MGINIEGKGYIKLIILLYVNVPILSVFMLCKNI